MPPKKSPSATPVRSHSPRSSTSSSSSAGSEIIHAPHSPTPKRSLSSVKKLVKTGTSPSNLDKTCRISKDLSVACPGLKLLPADLGDARSTEVGYPDAVFQKWWHDNKKNRQAKLVSSKSKELALQSVTVSRKASKSKSATKIQSSPIRSRSSSVTSGKEDERLKVASSKSKEIEKAVSAAKSEPKHEQKSEQKLAVQPASKKLVAVPDIDEAEKEDPILREMMKIEIPPPAPKQPPAPKVEPVPVVVAKPHPLPPLAEAPRSLPPVPPVRVQSPVPKAESLALTSAVPLLQATLHQPVRQPSVQKAERAVSPSKSSSKKGLPVPHKVPTSTLDHLKEILTKKPKEPPKLRTTIKPLSPSVLSPVDQLSSIGVPSVDSGPRSRSRTPSRKLSGSGSSSSSSRSSGSGSESESDGGESPRRGRARGRRTSRSSGRGRGRGGRGRGRNSRSGGRGRGRGRRGRGSRRYR